MHRIFLLFIPFLLFSAPLKIISLKEQNNGVQIGFNQPIKQSDFKKYTINNGIYYDIQAELTTKSQTFNINKNTITVAQNTKSIVRIVIKGDNITLLQFTINKNNLQLSFDKQSSTQAIDKTDSDITNLFNSIDEDKTPDIPNQNQQATSKENKTIDNTSKIIVLDPGHGGKDCGAQVNKVCEKTITLKIAKLAQETLKSRGYQVFMTRSSDKYISLTDRTKLANDKNADIFISIHANALDKKSKNYSTANGIETYFLSTARSERARKVAEAENKDDVEVMNYFSKLSFLNSINSHRLLASNKLAIDIQTGMLINTRKIYTATTDGGVREGPFWVLAGALMPSILVEVGYLTNKDELKRLQTKNYQQSIATGIADGIDAYFLKNF